MCAVKGDRALRLVCERDLGVGKLPAFWSFVPYVGEARFLRKRLAAVGAGEADPAAENDGSAEVADEGRLDDVGVRVAAGMTYQVDESSLVRYLAACADEDVIVGDQLVEFCAIALSFLKNTLSSRPRQTPKDVRSNSLHEDAGAAIPGRAREAL